jgi:uncharacterized membrane protein YbhN (UPF0104 family)
VGKYLRFGISALLLGVFTWRMNWSDVGEKLATLRAGFWFAAAGLWIFGIIVSARRWQIYAKELGFERSLSQYCSFCFVGLFFNLVLPTSVGGDVLRVVYLEGHSGRRWLAFVSVLLERVNGLLLLIVIACAGLLCCPFALPGWIAVCVWGSAAGALLVLAGLSAARRSSNLSPRRREQLRVLVDSLWSPRLWRETFLLSLVAQVTAVLIVWCLAIGIGLDLSFAYVCVLTPMLTLLMLLPISVNGMGVREGGMIVFLAPLGIGAEAAITLAFLLFSVGAAVSLLGGLLYLVGPARKTAPLATPDAGLSRQPSRVPGPA